MCVCIKHMNIYALTLVSPVLMKVKEVMQGRYDVINILKHVLEEIKASKLPYGEIWYFN